MRAKFGRGAVRRPCRKKARLNFRPNEHVYERTTSNNPLNPPGVGWVNFCFKLRVSIGTCMPNLGAVRRSCRKKARSNL